MPPPRAGKLLGQTFGVSMWPALRPGDLLFGHPLAAKERPGPGAVLVARGPRGLIAHRLLRLAGPRAAQRFYLGGDLGGADPPLDRGAILAVASALHRKGVGFADIPGALPLGPLGRTLLDLLVRNLLRFAKPGRSPSEDLAELAPDAPAALGLNPEE